MPVSHHVIIAVLCRGLALTVLMTGSAEAYIDLGTTGMLSQLLYILFSGLLGAFSIVCVTSSKLWWMANSICRNFLGKKLTMIVSRNAHRTAF